jgi:hypothetical protein
MAITSDGASRQSTDQHNDGFGLKHPSGASKCSRAQHLIWLFHFKLHERHWWPPAQKNSLPCSYCRHWCFIARMITLHGLHRQKFRAAGTVPPPACGPVKVLAHEWPPGGTGNQSGTTSPTSPRLSAARCCIPVTRIWCWPCFNSPDLPIP